MAGSVSREAKIISISDGPTLTPSDPEAQPVSLINLSLAISAGTPTEQRVSFAIADTDYEALGSPPYGGAVTIELSTA